MQQIARVIPIKSKEALVELAEAAMQRPRAEREAFFSLFGPGTTEHWHYQEIDGKPYVLAVASGENLMAGFDAYERLDDAYFEWFSAEVLKLAGVDLRTNPLAAPSELVAEVNGR
ncbi:MAG: hypothetical protein AAF513_18590 [Pseudomonadota bacterium]